MADLEITTNGEVLYGEKPMTDEDYQDIWQSTGHTGMDRETRYNHVRNTLLFALATQMGRDYYRLVQEFDLWYDLYA